LDVWQTANLIKLSFNKFDRFYKLPTRDNNQLAVLRESPNARDKVAAGGGAVLTCRVKDKRLAINRGPRDAERYLDYG
jgi:hypothetical protein